jgi:enoyl-CoA hydratase/carnithine racemase
MPYEALRLEIHDRIATLTLNRPEAYNALNAQLAGELLDATTHT